MIKRVLGGTKFANVTALVALTVAVGGGVAVAGGLIGSNDIAKNAIRSKHIAKNQVRGADVRESSLTPTCPKGFRLARRDVCYGPERADAFHYDAIDACTQSNARVPSVAEAFLVLQSLPSGQAFEVWTDDSTGQSTAVLAFKDTFDDLLLNRIEGVADVNPFRCVTEPRG